MKEGITMFANSKPMYLLLFSALLLLVCGKPEPVAPQASVGIAELFDSTSFSGWIPDTNHFVAFGAQEFFNQADGGAQIYLNDGLVSATIRNLESPDSSKFCTVTIMDFGASAKASKIFEDKVSKNMAETAIPSFDTAQAAARFEYLGNILAYAHFDKFYFEILLTGFADSTVSIGNAALMLTKYKSMIP
jgi:hypothetical protein